jgi:hypothetical protein
MNMGMAGSMSPQRVAHYRAFQRCQAHGRVDGNAVFDTQCDTPLPICSVIMVAVGRFFAQ